MNLIETKKAKRRRGPIYGPGRETGMGKRLRDGSGASHEKRLERHADTSIAGSCSYIIHFPMSSRFWQLGVLQRSSLK